MTNYRRCKTKEIDEYFYWLLEYFRFSDEEVVHFGELFHQLFVTEFKCAMEKDLNRVSYGLLFRDEFYEISGIDISNIMWNCSVLELLMGLSKTIAESILGDLDDENLKKVWFFKWIENLGLIDILDNNGNYDHGDACIKLEIWMNRDFECNGLGSPFPLRNPSCDQRRAEIWKQVMLYLAENVPDNEY